jgi:hypothetical protein
VRRVRARLSEWEGGKERKEPRANASTPDTSVYTGRDPKVRPQKGHYHGTYLLTATDDHVVLPRAAHKPAAGVHLRTNRPPPARRQAASQPQRAARRVPCPRTTHARRGRVHAPYMHLRPRLGPATSLSPVRVRGRRAVVKDVGVWPPNDGQAAADDARARAHDRQETLQSHLTRSHTPALRNRNIKKVHGTGFQEQIRNRGVPATRPSS